MADATDTAAAGTTTPAAPPPVVPNATETPAAEPHWLKPRLDQALAAGERKALEKLGLSEADLETAKAAIAAAKAAEESKKSAEQRAVEAEARAKQAQSRAEQFEATSKEHAARMMLVLTEDQQKAVKAIAGEDAALQLRAIHALGPTWAAAAESAKATAAKTTTQAAPATTAPPPNAPGGTDPTSPPDHRAVYASLSSNPFERAAYGARHPEAYAPRK